MLKAALRNRTAVASRQRVGNDAKKAKGIERIKSGIAQAKQNGATDRDIIDALLAAGIDVSGALTVLPEAV